MKRGFTLAEGATQCSIAPCGRGLGRGGSRSALPCRRKKVAFTLAEVLITIGVIGVVAAITIPSLMTNINKRVIAHKKVVMEKKLLDGLNMMSNRENGLSVKYNNTEEFVRALSKYLKIVTICSNTTLNKCFPYNKVNYDSNGETKSVDLTSITTAKKLKLEGNWLDPAGFVMADGTPIIISYNNDCGDDIKVDPDKPSKSIPTACIDGLYDNNGSRPQNKFGKDVLAFGNAKIGTSCLAEPGGVCISSAPVVPTPMSKSDCETEGKTKYGINACYHDQDYWAGAMKMCKDQGGRLPTDAELTQLAQYLYNDSSISTSYKDGLSLDTNKLPESFADLGFSWYTLWSGSEDSAYNAYGRYFYSSYTGRPIGTRKSSSIRAVCVGE